jgi:hypothetical protein
MNADPLWHPSDREEVVEAFVREGRQQGRKILAIQCGIETAQAFRALGYPLRPPGSGCGTLRRDGPVPPEPPGTPDRAAVNVHKVPQ